MKTSVDVSRPTQKFYAQANDVLLRNCRNKTGDVKRSCYCMLLRSYCTNMYCCALWFNSTSSSVNKLKTSYNGVIYRILLIVKPLQRTVNTASRILCRIPKFVFLQSSYFNLSDIP